MEYECVYNPDLNIVEAHTHGMADMKALSEMLNRIADFCRQEKTANVLVDHSELDVSAAPMNKVKSLSLATVSMKDIFKMRKCAHVVAKDFQFGLVRAWEIMVGLNDFDDLETMLFKDRDRAIEWLQAGP